ncbi:chitobiase/beta-hexosaminidase C-terminal domain-containing protein [Candidatus Soleaferrea massiliensis]|uniref:chitobiase/beta-hexosaminidase C-terminal domain-containing protein n=1 Tax=Candidatus Soleaferrea massiliensis TaxID=1470354 RepID=UPI000694F2D9|nr:chitobiase/beta-hexosaminidase C-terminal domain-containing protein [Candidatus Soleaferrea massiliensis]
MSNKHGLLKKAVSFIMAAAMTVTSFASFPASVLAVGGDTFDINREVSRRFTSESLVLLRNNEQVLPLAKEDKVAVFGSTQVNTFKTVFGSGSTEGIGIGFVNTLDALKGKTTVDAELESMYREFARTNPPNFGMTYIDNEILSERSIAEMTLNDEVVSAAAQRNDKAVIFIGRTNGEGYDWKLEDEYQLRAEEQLMIDLVTKYFDKVTVVLNTASPIDMTWDSDKIDSILWVGIVGDQGANAIADVMSGEVNPSGRLTQTWAAKYTDTPTHMNYEMTNYPEGLHGPEVEYEEDIYGGYHYYDTFNVTPKFHFGFGLSYTTFDTQIDSVTADSETVTVKATVENTGSVAGKEVVQVYYSAPDGKLEKAYQQLAGFAKTDLLQPHQKQTVTISYRTKDMASYDEALAQYILEPGEYVVRAGDSSRSTHVGAVLTLDGTAVTEQLSNQMTEAIPLECLSKEGATPYSYEGEAEEIAAADRIALKAADFVTENKANTITDEPEELEGSIEAQFQDAVQQQLYIYGTSAANDAKDLFEVPGKVYCADLGVNFAGFVVNDPSGDADGYKSVTVQKAGTKMPFDIDRAYDYEHELSLRYRVESASSVTLRDQNDNTLCTFNLNELDQWATATVSGVDLSGVTALELVINNDNVNLNWLNLRSEYFAGVVKSSIPSGTYGKPLLVSLYNRDETDAYAIRYTTDGSEPNAQSALYTEPIEVSSDMTIKAYAIKSGRADSKVMTADYVIDTGAVTEKAPQPQVVFLGKDGENNQRIKLNAQAGMSVFYTTDGSEPTMNSTLYAAPFSAAKGTTVKAIAVGSGYLTSDAAEIRVADVGAPTAGLETLGTYEKGGSMTLSADEGLDIYYTISRNGSEPQDPTTQSQKYDEPIAFDTTGKTIIKAIASDPQSGTSETAVFVYNIVDKLLTLEDVYYGNATVEQVVAQMTVTELSEVVCNSGYSTRFRSPNVRYADGPLGVKVSNFTKWAAPSLLACAWDVSLFAEQGNAIGKEMVEDNIDFWLAPGINILRDPRSGRNPEYYSEDYLLTGILASSVIQNVQKHNVGCVIKHYVGNDQETHRKQCANAIVSERAMREVYLKAFEIVVETSQPWALMTTYCDVNRIATATNFELCTAIPRGEWGFEGIIMTDWGCYANQGMMMYAGNDMVMPSGSMQVVGDAVRNPDGVDKNDPNYTKPTTKAMLQRNVANIFSMMSRTRAFSGIVGQPQKYQYEVPETKWMTTSKETSVTNVNASASANGAVTPASQQVTVGNDAVITVTPESGYVVDSVSIEPNREYILNGSELTVKAVENYTNVQVSFRQIAENPDFDALNALITSAENRMQSVTVGGNPGNYLPSSIQELTAAVDAAKAAAGDADASVMDIEQAILSLKQAMNNFEAQVVTQITHVVTRESINKIKAIEHADASKVIGSENCNDSDGGRNTTGTYKGTYLSYVIDVADADVYSLCGRISTNEDGCGFEVYIDGELQGTIVQEAKTGGWQNWQTSDPLKVNLEEGLHTLKVVFIKSNINVNYFTLETSNKNVTVTTDGNGTVDQSFQKVEMGKDATINAIPNDGYIADSVEITPQTDYTLRNNVLVLKRIMADTEVKVNFRKLPDAPDFASLGQLIDSANQKLGSAVVDGSVGNYAPSTAKAFDQAIKAAQAVLDNSEATIMDVELAMYDLKDAIKAFDNGRLTAKAFILTNDQEVKIKATDHQKTSDGIGSEPCQDEDGGRNPIYTDGGTWLEYNLEVLEDGWFTFTPRVSVNQTGAGFRVLIDGENIHSYGPLDSTGGWQNWVTSDTFTAKLTEGAHTMRIEMSQSGMNVNWFKWSPVKATLSSETLSIHEDEGIISGIDLRTSAADVLAQLSSNVSLKLADAEGNELAADAHVTSATKLLLVSGGQTMAEYALSVKGDLGAGDPNLAALIGVKAHILGKQELTPLQKYSADVDGNGRINVLDLLHIKLMILNGD